MVFIGTRENRHRVTTNRRKPMDEQTITTTYSLGIVEGFHCPYFSPTTYSYLKILKILQILPIYNCHIPGV